MKTIYYFNKYYFNVEEGLRRKELRELRESENAALGLIQLYSRYDRDKSERNIRRAHELTPNNGVAYFWFTYTLYTAGRFAEGTKRQSLQVGRFEE